MPRNFCVRAAQLLATMLVAACASVAIAQQTVAIDGDDIGGVVMGPSGPEAGVWVIAETRGLPTRFARMVVTDDRGRYVVPDLPKATYDVWARGYGLVDGPKAKAEPGRQLNLTAVRAPNDTAAAQAYPAIYWYAMMQVPALDQFGPGNKLGIPDRIKQSDWLNTIKNNGCVGCHQLGQLSTRTIPSVLGEFKTHEDAWMRRVQSGQSGESMINLLAGPLGGVPFRFFGDWTERVAKGELPASKPSRPSGLERNVVVTTWDFGEPEKYLHDLIASDRRNPRANAYGPLYGSPEYSTDLMPILDPVKHTVTTFRMPVSADTPVALGPGHAASLKVLQPSPYWGDMELWDTKANNHNGMIDAKGRAWFAATGHAPANPDFCKKGSAHPSAKAFPIDRTNRRVTMYDRKADKYVAIQTCFGAHHLQFGYDANDTVWMSGGGQVVGWINTKLLDETGDQQKAQGWTTLVLDTNGNGRRDEHVEPNQPVDPAKDKRISAPFYAVMPHTDGSVWGSVRANPGAVARLVPGVNPPETALAEIYNVPAPGFGVRGADIDSKGVVWVSLASGHLGQFDRSKCKGPLNGPKATGDHCPEGWTFHRYPGPGFQGHSAESAEF